MGWQAFTHFLWGVDGYAPAPLIDKSLLDMAVNPPRRRTQEPLEEVLIAGPVADRREPWIGASAGHTMPGKHPGGDWARMGDEAEPDATPEFAAKFARAYPSAVATAQRHWARIRAVLVAHGLPDPGEGELLARSDYD